MWAHYPRAYAPSTTAVRSVRESFPITGDLRI
jgi:hypothetical protein